MARLVVAATALSLALVPAGGSAEEARCPPRCDLAGLRARARAISPRAEEAAATTRLARARRAEARALPARLGDVRLELGPTALRRGTLDSNAQGDVSLAEESGARVQLRVALMAPVTSWWRIASLWRGASSAVAVAEGEELRRGSECRLAAERAYRAAQLASTKAKQISRARSLVLAALERAERLLEEDLPGANETDRLRLELALSGLDAQLARSKGARARAIASLRAAAALPEGVRVAAPPLSSPEAVLAPLAWYLEAARRSRPEAAMGKAAAAGAKAMVSLQLGELVPDVGVVGYYRIRETPLVDDQRSSFIRDVWNTIGTGYGLLLDWSVDPAGTAARAAGARADEARARAMARLALGSIAFDVEGAYAEALEAAAAVEARERGLVGAESRLERAIGGTGDAEVGARELSGAISGWLDQSLALGAARRDALLALARLEEASGLPPGTLAGDE